MPWRLRRSSRFVVRAASSFERLRRSSGFVVRAASSFERLRRSSGFVVRAARLPSGGRRRVRSAGSSRREQRVERPNVGGVASPNEGGTSGEGGIRTRGTVARTHDFQSCTFDHSVTSPGAGRSSTTASAREQGAARFASYRILRASAPVVVHARIAGTSGRLGVSNPRACARPAKLSCSAVLRLGSGAPVCRSNP
jgi:hypothetical protein